MSSKIEIRKWEVIDIYFKEKDEAAVLELIEEYKGKGWTLEGEDPAGLKEYEYAYQLMRMRKPKTKRI